MYVFGWVYIIEQVNLYGINTKRITLKKNHYLQVRLLTIAAFINPAYDLHSRIRICDLQMRLLPNPHL